MTRNTKYRGVGVGFICNPINIAKYVENLYTKTMLILKGLKKEIENVKKCPSLSIFTANIKFIFTHTFSTS